MKKIVSVISALCICAFSVSAFEWGGRVSNSSEMKGEDFSSLELIQENGLILWGKIPLTRTGKSYIASEAGYKFKYDNTEEKSEDRISSILDINLLELCVNKEFGKTGVFSMALGRFSVSDLTGKVFNQVSDGLKLKLSCPYVDWVVYGGYTGLLNAENVKILNGDTCKWVKDDNDLYNTCAEYLPFGTSLVFPALIGNQSVTLEGWGFTDLTGSDERNDRYYGTFELSGYLENNVTYYLRTTMGTKGFENMTNLSSFNISVYTVPAFVLAFNTDYASGDTGKLDSFQGFSSVTATGSMLEPEYTGLLKSGFSFSKYFGKAAVLSGGADAVFSWPDNTIDYDGVDISGGLTGNIFDDFQLGVIYSQYIANDSDDGADKASLTIKAVIAF